MGHGVVYTNASISRKNLFTMVSFMGPTHGAVGTERSNTMGILKMLVKERKFKICIATWQEEGAWNRGSYFQL
jgi:hypothetical protein